MKLLSSLLPALGARLARCVSLALLPALTSESMAVHQPQRVVSQGTGSDQYGSQPSLPRSTPYLAAMLPAPLRFQEPPPPVDIVARADGANVQREAGAPEDPSAATHENAPATGTPGDAAASPEAIAALSKTPESALAKNSPSTSSAPLPILPDDTQRNVGVEDVLPYFQFPGNHPTPAAAAGSLPPSSATYRQR